MKNKLLLFDRKEGRKMKCVKCGSELEENAKYCRGCGTAVTLDTKVGFLNTFSVGGKHVVGIREDGTVLASGSNKKGQCNISHWRDMVSVIALENHTVGLDRNGNIFATGSDYELLNNMCKWENIKDIAIGNYGLGLRNDGRVAISQDKNLEYNDMRRLANIDTLFPVSSSEYSAEIAALREDGVVVVVGDNANHECEVESWRNIESVHTSGSHTVGLCNDGTVLAVGGNEYHQCDVERWRDIEKIHVSGGVTVGLRGNGTVVCTNEMQSELSSWMEIVDIRIISRTMAVGLCSDSSVVCAGSPSWTRATQYWANMIQVELGTTYDSDRRFYDWVVGVRQNGTVVSTDKGINEKVKNWRNIKFVRTNNGSQIVGISYSGVVVAVGNNSDGQLDISHWSDIKDVMVLGSVTLGLKTDGTVVAAGDNTEGRCNVSHWENIIGFVVKDGIPMGVDQELNFLYPDNVKNQINEEIIWDNIIAIVASGDRGLGLRKDGKVETLGGTIEEQASIKSWNNIRAIDISYKHCIGLKQDGTVVASGDNRFNECNVSHWTNIARVVACDACTIGFKKNGEIVIAGICPEVNKQHWIQAVDIKSTPEEFWCGETWAFLHDNGVLSIQGDLVVEESANTSGWKLAKSEEVQRYKVNYEELRKQSTANKASQSTNKNTANGKGQTGCLSSVLMVLIIIMFIFIFLI